jgi:hypothetical protein
MSTQQMLQLISSAIWPIVAISALVLFRVPITGLLTRITRLKVGRGVVDVTPQGIQKAQALNKRRLKADLTEYETLKKKAEELLSHEQEFDSSDNAFMKAKQFIEAWLVEQRSVSNNEALVELKLLTIAMTFSCRFVTQHIPQIISRYPEVTIQIQILIVDPSFLDDLDISRNPVQYGKTCRRSIDEIQALLDDPVRHQRRLRLTLRQYSSLPQWHGLLIGEDHLFMGRTDWVFAENEKPALSVGHNTYRHYGKADQRGEQRIKLFENWHRYYSDFASTPIIPSQSANNITVLRR